MALDVSAVRRRFSALQQELTFFDAPGGTRVAVAADPQGAVFALLEPGEALWIVPSRGVT